MSQQTDVDQNRLEELSSTFELYQPTKFRVDGIRQTSGKKEILLSWKAPTTINANKAIDDIKNFIKSKFTLPNNQS